MRNSFIAGLSIVLLLVFALPAAAEEPPAGSQGLDVIALVLDWIGVSQSQSAPAAPPENTDPSNGETTATESDDDGPTDEIGPIYDPGG